MHAGKIHQVLPCVQICCVRNSMIPAFGRKRKKNNFSSGFLVQNTHCGTQNWRKQSASIHEPYSCNLIHDVGGVIYGFTSSPRVLPLNFITVLDWQSKVKRSIQHSVTWKRFTRWGLSPLLLSSSVAMTVFDTVVVGAGVVGSATTYYLAKEGKSVLLLEQVFCAFIHVFFEKRRCLNQQWCSTLTGCYCELYMGLLLYMILQSGGLLVSNVIQVGNLGKNKQNIKCTWSPFALGIRCGSLLDSPTDYTVFSG